MQQRTFTSPTVTVLFAVSLLALIADLAIIFAGGHPGLAKPLGIAGCVGLLASVWVSHKQTPA